MADERQGAELRTVRELLDEVEQLTTKADAEEKIAVQYCALWLEVQAERDAAYEEGARWAEGIWDSIVAEMRAERDEAVRRAENLQETVDYDLSYQRMLEAKIERVRALHAPSKRLFGQGDIDCASCDGPHDMGEPYPCPTIRALDGDSDG